MPNYEKHLIAGHVGRAADVRYTNEGRAVADFSVAVNNPFRKDDPPTWYKVTAWGKLAETVNQYVEKGMAVLVEGDRLELDEWTGDDGTPRTSLVLTAQRVVFLTRAGETADAPREQQDMPF